MAVNDSLLIHVNKQSERASIIACISVKLGIPASARASLGVYNTKDDLDKLNDGINNCKKVR